MAATDPADYLPFHLTGTVTCGKQLGSRLGFPTANLAYDAGSAGFPPDGVYIARATLQSGDYLAILNQGHHPTAPGGAPTVEAHLLGLPYQPLYGESLTLCYLCHLRSERSFPSLEALKDQLARDREAALRYAGEKCPELLPKKDPTL